MSTVPRPALDPSFASILEMVPGLLKPLMPEGIPEARVSTFDPPIAELLQGRDIEQTDHAVQTPDGAEILVSVLRKTGHVDASAPGLLYLHGGGMVAGDRHSGVAALLPLIEEHDVVVAGVEYRLAPEHPDPTPVEDCYTALTWFVSQHAKLGFDDRRVMVMGSSAGGGLAAGTTLLARDRKGPHVAWQLLQCPMLDDRDQSVSARQMSGNVPWGRESNRTGWQALLGARAGSDSVSYYAAPSRATDLRNLPPTFIDVGDAEVFRDEAVNFASNLWRAGVNCELHVWPGGFHGFTHVPGVPVAEQSLEAEHNWVRRQFGRPTTHP